MPTTSHPSLLQPRLDFPDLLPIEILLLRVSHRVTMLSPSSFSSISGAVVDRPISESVAAVALLHIERRVVAENERNALILACAFLVLLRTFGMLLVKDNRRSVFVFADVAFQCLRLLERKPNGERYALDQSKRTFSSAVGIVTIEIARKWPGCEARSLPQLFPRNHAALRLEMMRSVTA